MNNLKVTPSQLALWHAVTALVLSTAMSSALAIFQFVSSHPVNIGQDVSYGLMVLLSAAALLPVSIYHLVQNNPALPQAEADAQAQAQQIGTHVVSHVLAGLESHFKALETSLANHAHVSVPTPPIPTIQPQTTFPPLPQMPIGPAVGVPGATSSFNPAPSFTVTSNSPQVVPLQRDWTAMTPVVKPAQP